MKEKKVLKLSTLRQTFYNYITNLPAATADTVMVSSRERKCANSTRDCHLWCKITVKKGSNVAFKGGRK